MNTIKVAPFSLEELQRKSNALTANLTNLYTLRRNWESALAENGHQQDPPEQRYLHSLGIACNLLGIEDTNNHRQLKPVHQLAKALSEDASISAADHLSRKRAAWLYLLRALIPGAFFIASFYALYGRQLDHWWPYCIPVIALVFTLKNLLFAYGAYSGKPAWVADWATRYPWGGFGGVMG